MSKSKFSTEQIVDAINEVEMGVPLAILMRRMGISARTFYKWRDKFSGLNRDQAIELRRVEFENKNLKKIVAELTLDKAILHDILSKTIGDERWKNADFELLPPKSCDPIGKAGPRGMAKAPCSAQKRGPDEEPRWTHVANEL